MEDGGFGSGDESLWSPDSDELLGGTDLFTDPEGATLGGLMETEGFTIGTAGGGDSYASITGQTWEEANSGGDTGGGYNSTGTDLEFNVGGAVGGDLGDGYNSTGSDVPVDMGGGTVGGAFSSIGAGAASLYKMLGGLINPISTAITGKPLINTATPATAAAAKAQQTQNLLIIGAVGVGAYLLLKK